MDKKTFDLGIVAITNFAKELLVQTDVVMALARHSVGDWGDLSKYDKNLNDKALEQGGRLLSCYKDTNGNKFYIITEHDRSITTILLTYEY